MNLLPLFAHSARLAGSLPVAGFLAGPTAVGKLGPELYVKRDDLSAADYGGNKVRKLDFLLADARARGVRELLGFGYAGSNFIAATAWHGRKLGLHTIGYLLPQAPASYVADNLSVALHSGAELRLLGSTGAIARAAVLRSAASLLRRGRLPAWIPPGGSSPLGVMGFVNAAFELRAQIEAGLTPAPALIYVAFSSMGTVAGLALGAELAGLKARIVAAQVVDARFAGAEKLRGLLDQTDRFLRRRDPALGGKSAQALQRIQIRTEFFGEAYARPTAATRAAMQRFSRDSGARADSAYTGKALACLYHDLDSGLLRGKTALYWHSFNAHGLPPGVRRPQAHEVAPGLREYFASAGGP